MQEKELDRYLEKARSLAVNVADRIPLPLHYILNGILIVFWLGDLVVPDMLPLVDEVFGAGVLYYYNAYLLKRTYGVINPLRILRGESPTAKRRLGLLPYENQMEEIKARLKSMGKAARGSSIPGLDPGKVKQLSAQIAALEKRLRLLDRILTRPAFQVGAVTAGMARLEVKQESADDPSLKEEYRQALEHSRSHLANIERLREERNRLVAKMDRLQIQLDDTYSRLMAMAATEARETDPAQLFNELFASVSAFDETLKELEAKPSPDLFQKAVKEIEETEARAQGKFPTRETEKKL